MTKQQPFDKQHDMQGCLSRNCGASSHLHGDPNLSMWGSGSECADPTLPTFVGNSQASKPKSLVSRFWTLLTAPISIFWTARALSSARSKLQQDRQDTDDLARRYWMEH